MPYALGIDLGSGRTTAAISRNDRERWLEPEVVALDGDPGGVVSVLHVTDQDAVEVGTAAMRALPTRAGWLTRGVLDRIGDEIPVTLGGRPYPAEVLTAALVGWVVDYVEASEGAPASQLVVTHPAGWGPHRRGLLSSALRDVNLPELTLLPRPVAAAECHAAGERVEVGEEIAVHSLGSGRFESAVLRRGSFGFELRAHADGAETVGGELFDDLLAEHVLTSLEVAPKGVSLAKLRAAATAAKERLSTESAASVSTVRVLRAEFEELIRPAVESTVESLRRTIKAAASESLRAVVLVGGSGRIPLVTELVAAGTRVRVVATPEPETAIARGAARAAARVAKPTVRAPALTMTPEPIARSAVTHTDLMRLDDLPPEDLSDLGPPPPRPPVDIPPLDPPKRRLLALSPRTRKREEDEETPRRSRDREFADLDLSPPRRKRPRDPEPEEPSLTDIEGEFDLPEDAPQSFEADRDPPLLTHPDEDAPLRRRPFPPDAPVDDLFDPPARPEPPHLARPRGADRHPPGPHTPSLTDLAPEPRARRTPPPVHTRYPPDLDPEPPGDIEDPHLLRRRPHPADPEQHREPARARRSTRTAEPHRHRDPAPHHNTHNEPIHPHPPADADQPHHPADTDLEPRRHRDLVKPRHPADTDHEPRHYPDQPYPDREPHRRRKAEAARHNSAEPEPAPHHYEPEPARQHPPTGADPDLPRRQEPDPFQPRHPADTDHESRRYRGQPHHPADTDHEPHRYPDPSQPHDPADTDHEPRRYRSQPHHPTDADHRPRRRRETDPVHHPADADPEPPRRRDREAVIPELDPRHLSDAEPEPRHHREPEPIRPRHPADAELEPSRRQRRDEPPRRHRRDDDAEPLRRRDGRRR